MSNRLISLLHIGPTQQIERQIVNNFDIDIKEVKGLLDDMLSELGVNKETAGHIAANSAEIAQLQQRIKDLEQQYPAQELRMEEVEAKYFELDREYSSLTEQQRAQNAEYQAKLSAIKEEYAAELSRVHDIIVGLKSQLNQAVSDIQANIDRGADAEVAAKIENRSLIEEIAQLNSKIRTLEGEKHNRRPIEEYSEPQLNAKEAAAEAARKAEKERKEVARLAAERRKIEEARKAEEQRKEVARLAAERRKIEEAARLVEARRKKAEETARLAEARRKKAEETARKVEEAKRAKQRREAEKTVAKYRRQSANRRGDRHEEDFWKSPPYLLLYTLVVLLLIGSAVVFILEIVGTSSTSLAAINMVKTTFYVSIGFLVIDAVIALLFPGKHLRRNAFTNVLKIAAALLGIATIVVGWITISEGRLSLDTKSSFYDEQYGVLYVELDTGFTAWEIAPEAEDVLILSEHDGLPVTGVHENAARNNSKIKTLTFTPQGNYELGKAAFKGCPYLTIVSFGEDSRFTVHEDVFADCKRLTAVDCGSHSTFTFERSNSFAKNNSFEGCPALSEFRINNSKLIVNTILDIECDNMLFGGETNAVIYVSGGETSYISDNVGGIVVGKDSSVVVVHYSDDIPVHVGTYRFEESFDFDGSTLFTAELVNWVFVQNLDYFALADEIYLPASVTYIPDNFFGDKGDGCTVYYAGSAEDWARLPIGNSGNDNYNNGKVKIVYDYVG